MLIENRFTLSLLAFVLHKLGKCKNTVDFCTIGYLFRI